LNAQDVEQFRESDLKPAGYAIEGKAFLEKLSDGSIQLRLSEDFDTPRGPDVRILLGNGLSLDNTVEIVNLTTVNHFEGELIVDVPGSVELDQFENVIFFCIAFNQLWASGEFSDVMNSEDGGGNEECLASTVSNDNGPNVLDICLDDSNPDSVSFINSLEIAAGENYAYLLTDANNILQAVISTDGFNFEGSGDDPQRVYGVHYMGTLEPAIGSDRMLTTATECFEHSSESSFILVTKDGCGPIFECKESLTATTDWAVDTELCPNDGMADLIELKNNLFIPPGINYVYLITDTNQILQAVTTDSIFDFEGSSLEEQRVYGLHFEGTLDTMIGVDRRATTASGCFTHSGDDLFLTINKIDCNLFQCQESLTATHDWVTQVDVCGTDGLPDPVFLQNNISTLPGENYAFLLTDENEILQDVITDTVYDFENTGIEEQRVYGISFSGELDIKLGEDRKNTTGSLCHIHSGDSLFIRINKTNLCTTSTQEQIEFQSVQVFPNPSPGLVHIDLGSAQGLVQRIELFDAQGRRIETYPPITQIPFATSGIYYLKFVGETTSQVLKLTVL